MAFTEAANSDVELVLDARAALGEGPLWDGRAQRLYWVDITAKRVHRFDPATGLDEAFDAGQPVGALGLREAGDLVLAVEKGFALLDPDAGEPRMLAAVEQDDPGTRMNDGACDAAGRFWAGTMAYDSRPGGGNLYRLDPDGTVARVIAACSISNGLDWSHDGRVLYYIDSPTQAIDAFDFEVRRGELGERHRVVEIPAEEGMPDGMTVDAEGFIWVALWGGGCVRRYHPDGRLDRLLRLPVSQVTSCTFGGPDLGDLYITTAAHQLPAERLRREPHAGGLFRHRPGVRGRPAHRFGG
jgi:sugar lactone lactonase YvrE